jgi:hypothetical protein
VDLHSPLPQVDEGLKAGSRVDTSHLAQAPYSSHIHERPGRGFLGISHPASRITPPLCGQRMGYSSPEHRRHHHNI